jgi:flagella basal body P-ring formation protein FlgA
MTRLLISLWLSVGLASAGCLPISGGRILGRDLALADARFATLLATLTVGFPPAPGAQRIYTAAELQHLARANGIQAAGFSDICFELPMQRFAEADAVAAMRRTLPAEAELKVVELAGVDVPAGTVEFPVEGLEPPTPSSHGVQLWRGYVRYAETRRVSVWARVEVTVRVTAVVAGKDLAQGATIKAASLRMETKTTPFDRVNPATRIEDVAGRMPKRPLQAGSIVPLNVLAEAPTVRKGDSVPVIVESGMAWLRFEAIAESAARDGDIVELRNPANGKTFRARLDAGPKAVIVIPGAWPL